MSHSDSRAGSVAPWLVIAAGCLIAAIGFGPRSTMGFFLTPMTTANGWSREAFSFAIALQNLVWGLTLPVAGMLADRFGTARVLAGGALVYAAGIATMSVTRDALVLQATAGVLVGVGVAGSAFTLVLAAFARLLPATMRPIAYGLGTAAGSFGQFLFAPIGQGLIQTQGWQPALQWMAASLLIIPLLAVVIRGRPVAAPMAGQADQTIRQSLREAFAHRSYLLLVSGFFVCGFQLGFITAHLPPYLDDIGVEPSWGGVAIALIGLFNIAGSLTAGALSDRFPKRLFLSAIYLSRAVVITGFLLLPPSVPTVLAFASLIGLTWLSTVPLTQSLVAVMFGTRYMATLYGFVFLSHQTGSFIAVWLGGRLYDSSGSYDVVWWLAVLLGLFAAVIHLPIRERPVPRLAAGRA